MVEQYFIGIDIGGTRIKLVLRSGDNILRQKVISKYSDLSAEKLILKIIKSVNMLLNLENINNSHLFGIGVGVPGIFEKNGTIINLPNLQVLNGVNFKKVFQGEFGKSLRVKVVNDAQSVYYFYRDELRNRGEKNVAFLTLGTSLGCCLVLNGKHYVGAGLASQLAGSYFISKSKSKRAGYVVAIDFILDECRKKGLDVCDFSDFKDLVKGNNEVALKVFEDYGENLGYVYRNLFQVLHLDKIYLCGGITNYSKYFLDKSVSTFENNGGSMGTCQVEIIKTKLEIGAIGASKMFK